MAASRPGPKKPKTAEELDKELDAFMGDSDAAAPGQEELVEMPVQDIEMA
jgi:THO complex subunit 4